VSKHHQRRESKHPGTRSHYLAQNGLDSNDRKEKVQRYVSEQEGSAQLPQLRDLPGEQRQSR
jgi:hypothetical protein